MRAVNLLGQLLQWSLFLNGTIFFGSRWHQNAFEACASTWMETTIREGGLNPPRARLARREHELVTPQLRLQVLVSNWLAKCFGHSHTCDLNILHS